MPEITVLEVGGTKVVVQATEKSAEYRVVLTAALTPANSVPMPVEAYDRLSRWLERAVADALAAVGEKESPVEPWRGLWRFTAICTEHEPRDGWVVYAHGDALPHLAAVGRGRLVYRIAGAPATLDGPNHGDLLGWRVRDPDPGHPLKDSPYPLEYME